VKDLEEEEEWRLRARVHELESLSEVSDADPLNTEHDELKMKTAELSKQSQHQVSQLHPEAVRGEYQTTRGDAVETAD
jgi:hypothetical protein